MIIINDYITDSAKNNKCGDFKSTSFNDEKWWKIVGLVKSVESENNLDFKASAINLASSLGSHLLRKNTFCCLTIK